MESPMQAILVHSAKAASAAVFRDEKLLGITMENSGLTHSRTPLPMAEELLRRTGTDDTGEIDAVTSSGRNMFLFFYNRPDDEPYDGLDLTVTLIPDDAYGMPDWSWAADLSSATAVFGSGPRSARAAPPAPVPPFRFRR